MQLNSTVNGAADQVMACVSSRSPNSERILRFASRLASRLNRNWYAVYVQTPPEEPGVIDQTTHRLLCDTLRLANQLGAVVFTFKSRDVAETLLRFARKYHVGQVLVGSPRPRPWWRRVLGQKSIAADLIRRGRGITVTVIDSKYEERSAQI